MDKELLALLASRSTVSFREEKGIAGGSGVEIKTSALTDAEYQAYCKEFGYVLEGSEEAKSADVKKVLQRERIKRFVGSNEKADRHGDIVRVDGWDTKDYKSNPVFLLSHDSSQMPIGKALRVWKGEDPTDKSAALLFDIYFPPESVSAEADKVFRLYDAGILNAVSVGFKPLDAYWPQSDDERKQLGLGPNGIDFRKQSLLELSAVSIPANSGALLVENAALVDMCKSVGINAELKPVEGTQQDVRFKSIESMLSSILLKLEDIAKKSSSDDGDGNDDEGTGDEDKGGSCTCGTCGNVHSTKDCGSGGKKPKKSLYYHVLSGMDTTFQKKEVPVSPSAKVDFSQLLKSFDESFNTPSVKETK